MKKGIPLFLLSLLFISPGCKQTKEVVNEYNIVPLPNQMIPQEGRFELSSKVKVVTTACTPEVKTIADSLVERIALTSGIRLSQTDQANSSPPTITFAMNPQLPAEGYELSVKPSGIILSASQPNGFFYGVQSLYQLLPPAVYGRTKDKKAAWSVPAVEIQDAPRFPYRGLMLDVCRHFSELDYIYKFIDQLAAHKMNTFHWHLTDDQGWRIEIKKYPKLTEIGSKRKETLVDYYYTNWPQIFDGKEHGGYYTQEQIKAVVAYAASKYITVIPEIEMPGHAVAAIASYPELSCTPDTTYDVTGTWGVFDQVFCPKEETFAFLEGVLDEVIELFPSSYIHIGGDECPKTAWKNCDHCQTLIRTLGLKDDTTPNTVDGKKHTKEEKLQSYVITRMEKYLNSKGRNIIGWDEILEGGLAPNATVMSWRGVEGGITAAKAGHNAIMTPNPYVYLDHYQEDPEFAPTTIGGYNTLKKTYSYNPVPDDADELVKKHIIGLQGNIWNEYMQNDERRDYQTFPRAIAIAETGWTENRNKNWNSFCRRMVEEFERMDIMQVKACRNFFDVNINTHVEPGSGVLNVVLESFYPNADIRYTTDGSEPTEQSERYTQPFALTGQLDLKAAVFNKDKRLGKVSSKPLYGNLISGKRFTTTPAMGWATGDAVNEYDVLGADSTTLGLTNGKRGNNASYAPWTSFGMSDTCDELEFIVNMEKPTKISKVVFGSLFNPAYRILPAGGASVEVSNDGVQYREVAASTFARQFPPKGRKAYTDSLSFQPTEAQFVKVKIQNGGTLRNGIDCRKDTPGKIIHADLYIDEIEIY
ncbi:family 20 glycosylhydrolase [Bacteroides sp.]|uniref:family 20 glycosylhydrolase n=1 Tax=Bacteroides sp. TaxID=29523 RepID=UPI002FC629A7